MPQKIGSLSDILGNARLPSQIIDGVCERHGEYTRNDCVNAGVAGECPFCREEEKTVEASARDRRREWGVREWQQRNRIPARFKNAKFSDFTIHNERQQVICDALVKYAERFPEQMRTGRSLFLYGATGTGKTLLACAALNEIAERHGQGGMYTTAYHLAQAIKRTFSDHTTSEASVIDEFVNPPLLVVDEVGVQYGSNTEKLLFFEVINGRYEKTLPTIVTSNLDIRRIGEHLGYRAMDRLWENGGARFLFDWPSFRK